MKDLKQFLGLEDTLSKNVGVILGCLLGGAILITIVMEEADFATGRDPSLPQPDPGKIIWYFDFKTETYHYTDERDRMYPAKTQTRPQQSQKRSSTLEQRRLIREYTKDPRERRQLIKLIESQPVYEPDIQSEIDMEMD